MSKIKEKITLFNLFFNPNVAIQNFILKILHNKWLLLSFIELELKKCTSFKTVVGYYNFGNIIITIMIRYIYRVKIWRKYRKFTRYTLTQNKIDFKINYLCMNINMFLYLY